MAAKSGRSPAGDRRDDNGHKKFKAGYQPTHHPSHSGLLYRPLQPATRAEVDAIFVPTIRHISVLREALQLGAQLGCPVIALCSRWSKAKDACALAEVMSAHLVAVEVGHCVTSPKLITSALLTTQGLGRSSDLSLKRNLGLALARLMLWKRIVFIDDDITDVDSNDVRAASAVLDSHPVVALENVGYPDNSVVCHAIRRLRRTMGITQSSFVGGGAMAIAADRVESFFPDIYNEDWFFMLGALLQQGGPKQIAALGKASQRDYDPFLDPFRARAEELGDCLGEGLYSLLDDNIEITAALEPAFWEAFLADRDKLLNRIVMGTLETRLTQDERDKMITSVRAAQGRRRRITPRMCVNYLEAWDVDRETWRSYLAKLPTCSSLLAALEHLGLEAWVAQTKAFAGLGIYDNRGAIVL